ncbi:MAG: hypothetical protein D8H95_33080 [Lachnospiraceae bacterium]|nr:MAG: hypothetical protein D8H95_33080 [Lachnospiraceae bacterium]
MDYTKDILNRLIDIYERREGYKKEPSSLRVIQIDIKKTYPAYVDRYNHNVYKEINVAIEKLINENLVNSNIDVSGKYEKVKLNVENISVCYKKVKRVTVIEQCKKIEAVLNLFKDKNLPVLDNILSDWRKLISEYKKLPYDIKYDAIRLMNILKILEAILRLSNESYIRNFSTAIFKDSKRFQREFKSGIESILFDYTDEAVERDKILEYYNLYENPTYTYIKGDAVIKFEDSVIYVKELPDGIALSNISLEAIREVKVFTKSVITVENLTTYHDEDEREAVYIYLGGYHNKSKQVILKKIYDENKNCEFLHEGDIDVYGFLILENLKEKTGIPFKPLNMDVDTLKRFFEANIYKELTFSDINMIEKNKEKLRDYKEVLEFMLLHNCKVEQESIKAVEILEPAGRRIF